MTWGVLVQSDKRRWAPWVWFFGLTAAVLLLGGLAAYRLFFKPLPPEALQIPRLAKIYKDPDGLFEIRGPAGWSYQRIAFSHEAGVRIRPAQPHDYMGVSEITVMIKRLEKAPPVPKKFLESVAEGLSVPNRKQPKKIQLELEPVKLLSGDPGLYARLFVRRFWVPLYQVSLYGIKGGNALCTVAATGLEKHSTLAPVFCLGLFETIKVPKS